MLSHWTLECDLQVQPLIRLDVPPALRLGLAADGGAHWERPPLGCIHRPTSYAILMHSSSLVCWGPRWLPHITRTPSLSIAERCRVVRTCFLSDVSPDNKRTLTPRPDQCLRVVCVHDA